MADMVAGLYAAVALLTAVPAAEHGGGQVVDVSLFEPIFSFVSTEAAQYVLTGQATARSGSQSMHTAPRNVYACADGRHVALSGSMQAMAERIFRTIGRPDLVDDPRFRTNHDRVTNRDALDALIGSFIAERTQADNLSLFEAARVTVGPVCSASELLDHPYTAGREVIVSMADDDVGDLPMHNVVPRLSRTPGVMRRPVRRTAAAPYPIPILHKSHHSAGHVDRPCDPGVLMTTAPRPAPTGNKTGMPPGVVVVGSLHYDVIVDAPDRPRKGETVTGRNWTPKFGGKGGNQAAAAQRQGIPTVMVSAVGKDDFGAALLAGLDRAKVDRSAVAILDNVGSGMSVAIFDNQGDYGAVIVSGANLQITAGQARDELLRGAKILVLQNEIPEHVNEAVARKARHYGITTILNAAPARAFKTDLPDVVDILVVNAIEAEMLGGGKVASLEDAADAAAALGNCFNAVVVTAGGDGVAYHDRSGKRIALPSIPVTVASTHGAGDTFVGTLAARLAFGDTLRAALDIANQEAARLVSTPESQRGF